MTTMQLIYDIGQAYWTSAFSARWQELVQTHKMTFMRNVSWQTLEATVDIQACAPAMYAQESDGDIHALFTLNEVVTLLTMSHGEVGLRCAGDSMATVDAEVGRWVALLPRAEADDSVTVRFWYLGNHGPRNTQRLVKVPTWADIERNYTAKVRSALAHLLTKFRPAGNGQLVLWNGVPGTGKTYALRALAREWAPWCEVNFITDPDNFFGRHVDYLMAGTLGSSDDDDVPSSVSKAKKGERWRLLVLEDAGELLLPDAREQVGQNLSRLLNLVDGLLGQGLKLLVLITTNEPITKIHPAVARAGRCASRIEFTGLLRQEAEAWLSTHGIHEPAASTSTTLADLYARLTDRGPVVMKDVAGVGF